MSTPPCPSDAELNRYLQGMLDDSESSLMETHLSQCAVCERKIDSGNAVADSLFQALKDTAITPAPSTVDELAAESIAVEAGRRVLTENGPEKWLGADSIGVYELVKTLGRGGMGNVYLAKHRKLKKPVAIKVLATRHLPDQSELIRRFEREIHAAGSLDHPTIVAARDAGEVDSNLFLVMDYIDGLDLSLLVRRVGNMSIADVCAIGVQVAMGLSHAHAQGMVHRDIKPSNIMLDQNGDVKILDFGLVLLNPWDEAAGELTTIGHFLGTLDYMAPEQAERSSSVDYRADLYSLGATLFRLLTGRPPLAATPNLSPLEKLRLLSDHTPPSLKTLRPDAPADLVQLIDSLLSTDPRQRPAGAANVAEKLEKLAAEADLRTLISQGMSHDDPKEDVESPPRLASYFESGSRNRGSKNRVPWLIAAGLLPLALLAGIAVTIATDNGTLRIESDDPNLQVNIARVGKADSKAELRVEQAGRDIRLASGEYEVRLLDAHATGFALERDRVLITRGDQEIVRVSRETKTVGESVAAPLLYNGKTYEYWIETLRTERRVSTLGEAVKAVVALANESQQLEAAKACLLPSRRYGAMVINPKDADSEDTFMEFYNYTFDRLDRNARLQAIVEEMEANHVRSELACRRLLAWTNFRTRIETLNEQPAERELWARLKSQLLEPIPQSGELHVRRANSIGAQFAILISKQLGDTIEKDPKAMELAQSVLADPSSFRQIQFDGTGRNSFPTVPFGFVQLIAKLDRIAELPIEVIVSSVLSNDYSPSIDVQELLSSIPERLRGPFCESLRNHLREGWTIPDSPEISDFLYQNEADPEALAKLLHDEVLAAKNLTSGGGMFGGGGGVIPEHYRALADRLEQKIAPTDIKPKTVSSDQSEAKFNRVGFEEWLEILQNERNPKLLCEAVQAVVTLAKTDDDAMTAAKACMVALRSYGGYYVGDGKNMEGAITDEEISQEFMGVMTRMYPLLPTIPAIQAIDLELQANHQRSAIACKLLLQWQGLLDSDPADFDSEAGRAALRSIANSLKNSIKVASPDISQDYHYLVKVVYLAGDSIGDDPLLNTILRAEVEDNKKENLSLPLPPSVLHGIWEVGRLEEIPVAKAATAMIGIDHSNDSMSGFGSATNRTCVERLREKDLVKLLGWYKKSALFASFYDALLSNFMTRPRVYSSIIEDFLVEAAPDPKAVRKTIEEAIAKLPVNGQKYENNGQSAYIYVNPTERAALLDYLNRTMQRLSEKSER